MFPPVDSILETLRLRNVNPFVFGQLGHHNQPTPGVVAVSAPTHGQGTGKCKRPSSRLGGVDAQGVEDGPDSLGRSPKSQDIDHQGIRIRMKPPYHYFS